MKREMLCGLTFMAATAAWAGDLKEVVTNAVQKLADQANYSWTARSASVSSSRVKMVGGSEEGKAEKNGFITLRIPVAKLTYEAVIHGAKGVIKTEEGWKTVAEAEDRVRSGGDARRPARMAARSLLNYRPPVATLQRLVSMTNDLKRVDDAYVGELPPQWFGKTLNLGPAVAGPALTNVHGKVTFWVKDDMVWKYEIESSTPFAFGGDQYIDSTSTVEFRDVGTTKVKVDPEALKKLSE